METVHFEAIGVEPRPCFICAAMNATFQSCLLMHAEDPEKVMTLFNIAGSKDAGIFANHRNVVQVVACGRHIQNLHLLRRLIEPQSICVEMIQLAMAPNLIGTSKELVRAVKAYERRLAQAVSQYDQSDNSADAGLEYGRQVASAAELFKSEFQDGPLNHTEIEDADALFDSIDETRSSGRPPGD